MIDEYVTGHSSSRSRLLEHEIFADPLLLQTKSTSRENAKIGFRSNGQLSWIAHSKDGESDVGRTPAELSLEDLVKKSNSTASDCDKRLFFIEDSIVGAEDARFLGIINQTDPSRIIDPNKMRKIPKTIHVTGKTRCLHVSFFENLNRWKEQFPDHSFYFHDEEAVDELLRQEHWTDLFPQLKMMQHCMISGAAKADLWRYLVLYKYGGIYTDMDSAPGVDLIKKTSGSIRPQIIITDEDDSFFVVERIGVLSQYFMATSPRHPLMYLTILKVFDRLMSVESVSEQYVPYITGPGALKTAFIEFMGGNAKSDGTIRKGTYASPLFPNNRSITVVGTRHTTDRYVHRDSIPRINKKRGYKLMGMQHFSSNMVESAGRLNVSCYAHLYNTVVGTG